MKILGIDPGYERLGVALIEKTGQKEKLVSSSCFTTNKKTPFAKRLLHIGKHIKEILEKEHPNFIAVETLLFNTNKKTAMAVSEVRGVILYEAACAGVEICEYTPPEIKMAVTGYGHSEKKQVQFMVGKILSLKTSLMIDDECDAIAVALTCAAHQRGPF
ncbi:MAG: crossover junction endodeoxyribonuclease RuvC [Candidatus Paceibacterota bacterium]